MPERLQFTLCIGFIWLVAYISGTFIFLNPNPGEWTWTARVYFFIAPSLLTLALFAATEIPNNE